MQVADPDERELRASLPDRVSLAVQLDRLLAAEHSAEVPQDYEDHRPFRPQLVEPVSAACEIQDHGGCCFVRHPHNDRMLAEK